MRARREHERVVVVMDLAVTNLAEVAAAVGGHVEVLEADIHAHRVLRIDPHGLVIPALAARALG